MDAKTKGAWLVHHTQKLQQVWQARLMDCPAKKPSGRWAKKKPAIIGSGDGCSQANLDFTGANKNAVSEMPNDDRDG